MFYPFSTSYSLKAIDHEEDVWKCTSTKKLTWNLQNTPGNQKENSSSMQKSTSNVDKGGNFVTIWHGIYHSKKQIQVTSVLKTNFI